MNKEWIEYYVFLEQLRKSGVTNMYGAAPYLESEFGINHKLATKILLNWMQNYEEISKSLY